MISIPTVAPFTGRLPPYPQKLYAPQGVDTIGNQDWHCLICFPLEKAYEIINVTTTGE
jgi:hypothetical protein